jgi:hypothetical protein
MAEVPGYSGIRAWANSTPQELRAQGIAIPKFANGAYLALSGGGSDGAFGAGVLAGWTKSGTRPQFDVVSGVSIGALMAPFAFLGPDFDPTLTTMFTSGVTKDVAREKWLPLALLGNSLLKPEAFYRLVDTFATPQLMQAVAQEDRKGRRLFIVTTNIDAQRPVLWDLGKIASSGRPDALDLFRKVLIASASIPAGYPPVLFNVTAAGRAFQEMHSDGGAWSQVFTIPEGMLVSADPQLRPDAGRVNLYVIVNNILEPEFQLVPNSTLGVLQRTYSTVSKSQTRASLDATYEFTRRVGLKFHVAAIDRLIPYPANDPFNPEYMRTLYQIGFDEATTAAVWKDAPEFDPPGD